MAYMTSKKITSKTTKVKEGKRKPYQDASLNNPTGKNAPTGYGKA